MQNSAEVIPAQPQETDRISHIYGEIVRNEKATSAEFDELRTLAHVLIEREALDAIVLAGTDFSFVFRDENTDFPHRDGARVHISAIMRRLCP